MLIFSTNINSIDILYQFGKEGYKICQKSENEAARNKQERNQNILLYILVCAEEDENTDARAREKSREHRSDGD